MAWRKAPETLVMLFHAALPDDARVERRKMFGYPAAFTGGNLFAGLHQEDLILRLPAEDRAQAQRTIGARPFEPIPGRAMREYVALADAERLGSGRLHLWLARSFAYVRTLPAKESRRTSARARRSTRART